MTVFDKLAAKHSWIPSRLTFLVRHGSNAYGTNVEGSDEDFKGALVAPKDCYTGFLNKFDQQELKDPDTVVYELRKFFSLAAACNPNIIEVLHVDPEDRIYSTAAGDKIFEAGNKFISKRVRHTFAGYASSQLGRIETHRRWLLNPPKERPERKDFKLPEKSEISENQLLAAKAEIKKDIEKFNLGFLDLREDQMIAVQNTMHDMLGELHITKDDMWAGSARKVGFTENFVEYMLKERQYESKVREWQQFQDWKKIGILNVLR